MNYIILGFLFIFLLIPVVNIDAIPGKTELALQNIQVSPPYPELGEYTTITADVYNSGIFETKSFASIITVGYFIDGKLLDIGYITNVMPGIEKKIQISSKPIWQADYSPHTIKVVIDYHDSLNDEYDSVDNNVLEKTLLLHPRNHLNIHLVSSPSYVVEGKNTLLTISAKLEGVDPANPIDRQEITLKLDDEQMTLPIHLNQTVYVSRMVNSMTPVTVESSYKGDTNYLPSTSSMIVYSIPQDTSSAIIMKIIDMKNQFNFENHTFEFVIFQDSYDNLFGKISPDTTLHDLTTLLVSLPPNHDYFTEVYVDGKLVFLTPLQELRESDVIVEELLIPESAEVRFRVTDESGNPLENVTVNNWIYSTITDKDGFTEWIEVLPTVYDTSYDPEIVFSNRIMLAEPFHVLSGEKKTVHITVNETTPSYYIPDWVKNNAGWWADGSIDDSSFIQSLQFLIQEDILKIPTTMQDMGYSSAKIPDWVKNNAGWWASDQIDDTSFIESIKFLIQNRLIIIP